MASSADRSYSGQLVPDVQAMTSAAAVPRINTGAGYNVQEPEQVPGYTTQNSNITVTPQQAAALAQVASQANVPSSTLSVPSVVTATPNSSSSKAQMAMAQPITTRALPTSANGGTVAATTGSTAGASGIQ